MSNSVGNLVEEGRLVFAVIARLCVQKYVCSQSVGQTLLLDAGVSAGLKGSCAISIKSHTHRGEMERTGLEAAP